MAYLHKIKAQLHDNVLTEDPNDFIARVVAEKSLSIDDICQSAANRGGADISAAAMGHAVQLWLKEMAYRLCDGFSINAKWFSVQANIKGVFNSPGEKFNPEKHTISFDFNQGSLLRKELGSVEVEATGSYKLEISTQFTSGADPKQLLKKPRSTIFERELSVA
ncbi:MAG: hypothetical protein LBQ76_01205 [Candidatus Fibromonas sp.]|jgi:hypothetical protein|nr:hypothetical protein [Candidatus Fibromonas sp.]